MMLQELPPAPLPLVDLEALAQLEHQLDDATPARAFARDYIAYFQDRYLRLVRAVGNHDLADAMDAVLSLRNSSHMVGAARLSAMAAGFESAVTSADIESARRALPGIEQCGLDTIDELELRYLS
jgi:HPt (histidine-containing phosphotransfer) domain-containing protein